METLRHYLDRIGIGPGDESSLVIIHKNTELQVSRRYLESEPMKHYLDMIIVDYDYPFTSVRGTETIKFWLEEDGYRSPRTEDKKETKIHKIGKN